MTSDYRVNLTISRVTPRSNGSTRTIVGLLAAGRTHEEILQAYPYLEADDIRAALSYTAWRTEEVELPFP